MRKIILLFFVIGFHVNLSLAQLPDFTKTDCNGATHHLYEELAAGNAVVLKFCATWCGPCAYSNPMYQSVWSELKEGNCKVKMFSMLYEDAGYNMTDCEDGAQYSSRYHLTMPTLVDIGNFSTGITSQFASIYGINAIPTTLVIIPNQLDPANSAVEIIVGAVEHLDDIIKAKLALGGFYSPKFNVSASVCSSPPFSATLTSNFPVNNLWSTNETSQSITVNQNGIYALSISNTGCSNSQLIEFNIPPVLGTASLSNTAMCENGVVLLDYSLPEGSPTDVKWMFKTSTETEFREYGAANNGHVFFTINHDFYPAGTALQFLVRVKNNNGSCSSNSNQVNLMVTNGEPMQVNGTASATSSVVCYGADFELNYTGALPNSYWEVYSYFGQAWVTIGAANQPLNPLPIFRELGEFGFNLFRVISINESCYTLSNTVQVNYIRPLPSVSGPDFTCGGTELFLQLDGIFPNILWSTGATTNSITVNPATTTNYSVRVIDNNGCSATVNHLVKVWSPLIPVIKTTANGSICTGPQITLNFEGTNDASPCTLNVYGQNPATTFVNSANAVMEIITYNGRAGEFSLINVEAGKFYNFSSLEIFNQLELVNTITNANSTEVLASGINITIWKAKYTGQVRFYTHLKGCGSSAVLPIARGVACYIDPSSIGSFLWMPGGQTTASITVNPASTTNYTLTFMLLGEQCSSSATKQIIVGTGALEFSTTNITCNSAALNWTSAFNPSLWELEYKSTAQGSKWINIPVQGTSLRSVTISGLKPDQNYQWHIRAECGNVKTEFSDAIKFKTLQSCANAAFFERADGEKEVESITELKVIVQPNPSNTNFKIVLGSSKNQKEPIKLIVFDMMGKVVETRTGSNGQIITLGDNYQSGTYLVRIIQGNDIKQLKLIKLP